MSRNIVIVNATQVVTSESHPEGLPSAISGYPKTFDSTQSPYNGDIELCMNAAKAEYYNRLSKNYADTNSSRVMKTVTLEMINGQQILKDSIGGLPVESEPEPEEAE